MDLKKLAMDRVMKLMQNPQVMKVAMDPRVMGVIMKAMSLRGQVATVAQVATGVVAKTLNLATHDEVKELKRTIHRLEEQLAHLETDQPNGG